tara:strand:- start:171 stop:389 length:219 start_codon:yes stop_codon:yes gene_type:complete
MNVIYIALLALAAFVAIWIFFVAPAERRHHERKLESLRTRIGKHQAAKQTGDKYAAPDGEPDSTQSGTGEQE